LKKTALMFAAWAGLLCAAAPLSLAEVRTRAVEYRHGDAVLEGYLAYDAGAKGDRPGVLVVHAWMGLDDHARDSARKLAGLGYTALAVDMYGKGIRPSGPQEAGAQASIYKKDRRLMRDRVLAGLEILKAQPGVKAGRIAAIGYCFGGTTVLELARSGALVRGVVSFHGGLDAPLPADAPGIRSEVLVLHGAEDPYAPMAEVRAFEDEMRAVAADWQVVLYSGAVHSFTDPDAGNDPSKGAAYDPRAARRSWEAMKDFLREVLKP
jgi:dienelactone hydrolase